MKVLVFLLICLSELVFGQFKYFNKSDLKIINLKGKVREMTTTNEYFSTKRISSPIKYVENNFYDKKGKLLTTKRYISTSENKLQLNFTKEIWYNKKGLRSEIR
jgi:hypothetical protein